MPKKLTTIEFIEKSKQIHKNNYDYSEVEYINAVTKVKIKCKQHGLFLQNPSDHTQGYGCKKCASENNKNTKSDFVNRAINIHGNKYTYENFVYVTHKTKGTITCALHGNFLQTPSAHVVARQGCPRCGGTVKSTTTNFIKKARLVHNNTYDYSETNYTTAHAQIRITCKTHGIFYQVASEHLKGCGCSQCGRRNAKIKNTHTTEQFIQRAKKVHGNLYDYSLATYTKQVNKIKIICKTHGKFLQTPSDHVNAKAGCPVCGGRMQDTTETFIKKARLVHGDTYDYSNANYVKTHLKVCIVCKKHGAFFQTPKIHLQGSYCPKCMLSESKSVSKKERQWLDFMKVPDTTEHRQVCLPIHDFRRRRVDGFVPETNTVYEFYGDYWHGNPNVYSPIDINKTNYKTFGELYEKTQQKRRVILTAGYNLVEIWESEWEELKLFV